MQQTINATNNNCKPAQLYRPVNFFSTFPPFSLPDIVTDCYISEKMLHMGWSAVRTAHDVHVQKFRLGKLTALCCGSL